jgi:tRNA U34 5-methylaminomethyl-2-thiouridine-forming methyltransferase MnmC
MNSEKENMDFNTGRDGQGGSLSFVKTDEGIHTLYSKKRKEHYHSIHGSLSESMQVFIRNGLLTLRKNQKNVHILEMGFGTGLNAILTYRENLVLQKHIHYTAVEAFPLPNSVTDNLNYFEYFAKPLQPVFQEMHACTWFENCALPPLPHQDGHNKKDSTFVLHKIEADLLELHLDGGYDLVYYDAFSPTHQPELWTYEVLRKIYDSCKRGALLVTYSSKNIITKTLEDIGFEVEIIPGIPGKREMIRAVKK